MAQQKNAGVICMTAVRNLLRRPDYIRKKISDLKARGFIVPKALLNYNHLSWLTKKEDVLSLPAVGYKYVAAHSAIATVLTGTTNIEHLEDNARAILGPPSN